MSIKDCGFFVLRTPLLPIDEAQNWSKWLKCAEAWRGNADAETLKETWCHDLALLRTRLRESLQRREVIQALTVASASLQSGIAMWERDPESKKGLQAERSLVRYFMRMAGRSTPFGLFSGCSIGTVRFDSETELTLAPREQYRTATRLDFDYLVGLTSELRRDPVLQMEMRYGPNSSLHRAADGWHYVESRLSGAFRTHHLVKLASDEFTESVLACSKLGNRSVGDLAKAIRSCEGSDSITTDEIDDYIRELISSDILVPSISPVLTCVSPIKELLSQLSELPSAGNVVVTLASVKERLSALDRLQLGVSPEEYRGIAEQLRTLPGKVDEARLLQVDMFKPVRTANLGQAVLDELYSTLDLLGRISRSNEPDGLAHFRDAFTARYQEAWVPLVEAIDLEIGIGYGRSPVPDGSPLLRGLPLATRPSSGTSDLDAFQTLLLQKILECARKGQNELELHPGDFPPSAHPAELLPESFFVMVSLVAPSPDAGDQGEFELVYKGGGGPSCARMLGRFCTASPELDSLVRAALREEESHDPEAVYAEIVYFPEGRIGNVLCRPVLRDYEIVHLGRSGAPSDRQLPLEDLLVSVRGGKIVLYSERLGRIVKPRMSNAHGFLRTTLPPFYRFLCDLQNQGGRHVPYFSWGALSRLSELPRVRIGRVVLSPAQWRLSADECKTICDLDRFAAFLRVKEVQRQRGLPRWVLFAESDHNLPVDLDNPLSVDALIQVLRRSQEALLVEMYPQPGRSFVSGPEGSYEHELLIPLAKQTNLPSSRDDERKMAVQQVHLTSDVSRAERFLPPDSDWQFVKLYSGTSLLDEILVGELAPLLSCLSADSTITRWFFVRYADPAPHLRIRFQTPNRAPCSQLGSLLRSLITVGRLWKVQFDTYQREVDRYGGLAGALASEEVFCADSEAVLDILQTLQDEDGLDARWRIALLGINGLLNDCNLDLNERLDLMARLRDSYSKEFQLSSDARQKIGDRFRNERTKLQAMLFGESAEQGVFEFARRAFARRSKRTRSAIASIRVLERRKELAGDFSNIVGSYIHLHVNRLIRSAARTHELVLYDFLYRLYDGDRARKKRPVPKVALDPA